MDKLWRREIKLNIISMNFELCQDQGENNEKSLKIIVKVKILRSQSIFCLCGCFKLLSISVKSFWGIWMQIPISKCVCIGEGTGTELCPIFETLPLPRGLVSSSSERACFSKQYIHSTGLLNTLFKWDESLLNFYLNHVSHPGALKSFLQLTIGFFL